MTLLTLPNSDQMDIWEKSPLLVNVAVMDDLDPQLGVKLDGFFRAITSSYSPSAALQIDSRSASWLVHIGLASWKNHSTIVSHFAVYFYQGHYLISDLPIPRANDSQVFAWYESTQLLLDVTKRLFSDESFTPETTVDFGCGAGILGLQLSGMTNVHLVDINPRATEFAQINRRLLKSQAHIANEDAFHYVSQIATDSLLVIANAPITPSACTSINYWSGGSNGTEWTRKLLRNLESHSAKNIHLLLETQVPLLPGVSLLDAWNAFLDSSVDNYKTNSIESIITRDYGRFLEQIGFDANYRNSFHAKVVAHITW